MDVPRSSRRKSKICYKEDDSFADEFGFNNSKQNIPRKSTRNSTVPIEIVELSDSSDSDDALIKIKSNKENTTNYSPTSLKNIQEVNSWNPIVLVNKKSCIEKELVHKHDAPPNTPVRRGTRPRQKTALAKEAEESCKMFKKLSVKNNNEKDDSESDSSVSLKEKPSALFCDEDVEGKDMFKFKMTHKRESMLKKAIETALESPKITKLKDFSKGSRTSRTPKSASKLGTPSTKSRRSLVNVTPRSGKLHSAIEKTPHHVRNKMKKKLQTLALSDSEGSDFEDSGSDFQPSADDSSSENDQSFDSEKDSEDESSHSDAEVEKLPTRQKSKQTTVKSKCYSLRKTKNEKDEQFVMKSDNYFSMQSSKKVVTSNHTLERLKTPRLTEDKLQDILSQQQISREHRNAIQELNEDYQRLFDKWIFILSEGYSILLHGVGSKYKLIQDFQTQKLSDYPCIAVNGFFPSLTLKDILEMIIVDLLEYTSVPSNIFDAVRLIEDEMENGRNGHLFLLIHNIDGAMLKNSKTQTVLSKIAKIKHVHLIASVDHINAPLIWDHSIIRNFNFSWWDVTTLLPYTKETSFENSLMVHKSGVLALTSLKNVFQSLTTNARGIFMIVAKNQLKNKKTPHYQGISFKDLYWSSRESFLVSSDLALRAQLTEFLDHKLVKAKRSADGIENLVIPIDNTLLQQFLDENDN